MGRHAAQRSRTLLSLVAGGAAAALVAGILSVNGSATAEGRKLSDNLVTNPDFESGTTGWNAQSRHTVLAIGAGHDSRRAAQVSALDSGAVLVLNDSPNVVRDATSGATYVASVWVRTDTPGTTASLRFREVGAAALVGHGQVSVALRDSSWIQIKAEYTVAGPGHQLAVQVISTGAAKGSTITVDDVDVREVLESGTSPSPSPTETAEPPLSPSPTPVPSASKSESATPKPTPTDSASPSAPTPSDTLFGVTMWMNSGESWSNTFNRLEGEYGRIDVVRAFSTGLPPTWTSGLLSVGPRPVNVSFKAAPADVLSGKYDATFSDWFRNAPRDRQVWWTYYHEPEDNIASGEFTAADYRQAWRHLVDLADAQGSKNLKATLVLMDWSLFPNSGRNWKDYYPGADYIDVLAWDSYNSHGKNPTKYVDPTENFGRAVQVSKDEGKPFAFAEWGSQLIAGDAGAGRAAWIKASAKYFASVGAEYATYFDAPIGAEYRLFDQPSKDAMRDIMNGAF